MKKKNVSGFTLVELIIVIALLSIMMGAILQLMDPIQNVYHDTLDTVNTKTVGETLISFVEDKTRYATNMLILKDYQGVPQITQSGSDSAKVGGCSVDFTDVLIIDNNNLRSYGLSSYAGDRATVATRKNCRGTLYAMSRIGESEKLDLSKLNTGTIGDDIYGPYTYDIKFDVKNSGSHKMLNFDIYSYEMVLDNGSYVRAAEPEFKASRYFDLVNINLPNDSYTLNDYVDFNGSSDYSKYPQETSAPAGLTSQQTKFFNTSDDNNRYTYIFYKVNKTNEAQSYNVKFIYNPNDDVASLAGKNVVEPRSILAGKTLTAAQVPAPPVRTGYDFSQYEVDGSPISIDDIPTYVINNDTTFILSYSKNVNYCEHTLKFLDVNGADITPADATVINGENASMRAPTPTYDPEKEYYEWREVTTNQLISDFSCVSTTTPPTSKSFTFRAYKYNKCKVTFKSHDAVYATGYAKPGDSAIPPQVDPTGDVANSVFAGWFVEGTNEPIATYAVTADTTFTARFNITTPASPSPSVNFTLQKIDVVGNWGNSGQGLFFIKNNSSVDLNKRYKFTFKPDSGITIKRFDNAWGIDRIESSGIDGGNIVVYVDCKDHTISAGATKQIFLQYETDVGFDPTKMSFTAEEV